MQKLDNCLIKKNKNRKHTITAYKFTKFLCNICGLIIIYDVEYVKTVISQFNLALNHKAKIILLLKFIKNYKKYLIKESKLTMYF